MVANMVPRQTAEEIQQVCTNVGNMEAQHLEDLPQGVYLPNTNVDEAKIYNMLQRDDALFEEEILEAVNFEELSEEEESQVVDIPTTVQSRRTLPAEEEDKDNDEKRVKPSGPADEDSTAAASSTKNSMMKGKSAPKKIDLGAEPISEEE